MRRSSSWRAHRRTCTWAGRRASPRSPVATLLASRSCAITWPAAWAARRATARSSRRCRSRSTTPCGSTTASSRSTATCTTAARRDLGELVDDVMSEQLGRDRPLWELWIADDLPDGRVGVIGKAHHAMVDGIAAVELASLLVDPTPEAAASEPDGWLPARTPDGVTLLVDAIADRAGDALGLVRWPLDLTLHPRRLAGLAGDALPSARALADSLRAAAPQHLPQRADLPAPAPRAGTAPAGRPAPDQGPLRRNGQRRGARRGGRRGARVPREPRGAHGAAEDDGAGERARPERGERARQPDLVRVRGPAVRRAGPAAAPRAG